MKKALERLVQRIVTRSTLGVMVLALLSVATPALAQSTDASIAGSVRDSAGTPLAGATVFVRNANTGGTWTLAANSSGRFAFVQLPLGGPYTIAARRFGFESETRTGYELTLGRRTIVRRLRAESGAHATRHGQHWRASV